MDRFFTAEKLVRIGTMTPHVLATVRATLRHPDRIIVGEVRGGEAFDLLQALNTGHSGSLSTIHANSAEQALTRLSSCVESGFDLPYQAVRYQIADAIDLVLQVGRHRGARVVQELLAVAATPSKRDAYDRVVLVSHRQATSDPAHGVASEHRRNLDAILSQTPAVSLL